MNPTQQDIQNFINFDSWFNEFKTKPGGRYYTFKAALNLMLQQEDSRLILETGSVRQENDWTAGYSTYIFGRFCKQYDKQLFTIDSSSENLEMAKRVTSDFKDNITYVLSDSVAYLEKFSRPIDLLYLDSLDCPTEDGSDASAAQKHTLKELLSVYKQLTPYAGVMIDDNDWDNGGKSLLAKRYLFENNWRCVLDERQSLWIRR